MYKKAYKTIARKHGISVTELKREIQITIDAMYVSPNEQALRIPRRNAIPTVDEFFKHAISQISKDTEEDID